MPSRLSVTFFRSIGGSVGLAVFGSVMNNRFASELGSRLPSVIKEAMPPEQLDTLMHNPEILMSQEAQNQLQTIISQFGDQSAVLLQQVMQALRESLSFSIAHVFFYSFVAIAFAFIVNLFIKEIPLRKQHGTGTLSPANKTE